MRWSARWWRCGAGRAERLRGGGPGGRRLAPVDRRDLRQVLSARRGELVPALAVYRLGRRRGIRRVHDGPGRLRAPAASRIRRPELAPLLCAGIIGYRALRRAELPPEAAGHLRIRRKRAPGRPGGAGGRRHGARAHPGRTGPAARDRAGCRLRRRRRGHAAGAAGRRDHVRPGRRARATRAGRAGPRRDAGDRRHLPVSDIPPLDYERICSRNGSCAASPRTRGKTAQEFLGFAGTHRLAVTVHPYPLDRGQGAADL